MLQSSYKRLHYPCNDNIDLFRSASGRRISFDDNIQLIDGSSAGDANDHNSALNKSAVSDDFLIGLEKEN